MADAINMAQIEVCSDGPYIVTGAVTLIRMTQVVSEYGEPLAWRKDGELKAELVYFLCRCGHSRYKPYCDGTHLEVKFDGTEAAPVSLTSERREIYPGGRNMIVRIDVDLCTESGFCANRNTSIAELVPRTDDPQVREMVTGMIEHCPSGALTYTYNEGDEDIEVKLPEQIAITTEVISEGPIEGPFWVMGNIPIIRSDGKPFERRSRNLSAAVDCPNPSRFAMGCTRCIHQT
jgi:CDGSH-type Zn-finger protein